MEAFVFDTALGHAALARQDEVLLALTFGHSNERTAANGLRKVFAVDSRSASSPFSAIQVEYVQPGEDELVDQIRAFANGEACDFDDLQVDASYLTVFGRKVSAACRKIPRGETLTYGQLAKNAGRPGAARAVGSVMSHNRIPLIVPCHRVVPASGGLGGFSAPQGVAMKQRLLEMEQSAGVLLAKC